MIPRAHRFEIERPALLKRLRDASGCCLVVVVGPAGYGKTTLLGQFARRANGPVVWLTLSPDDGETLALGYSLAEAVSLALPDLSLERWQKASALASGAERLASSLAADLNRAPDNLMIVLDALDHLSAESGRWFEAFIRNLGEGHQVLVAHRGEVEADFSRLIADGEALLINSEELTFSPEESRRFLHLLGSRLDPVAVHEKLAGWPAALGMVAHGAPLNASPGDLVLGILGRLSPRLRSALPEAAVLETWDEASIRKLGCVLPEGWLREVRRIGLPMMPLGHDTYRPHRVLLEVLEKLLRERPERHAELHLAAAREAESRGQLLFALHHLQVGGHDAQALRLIEELLPRWERRSDWTLVREALDSFPQPSLPPRLKTALGIALIETGEPTKGEVLLRELVADRIASGMTYFGLTLIYYRQGDGQATLDWASEGLAAARDQREVIQLLRSKAAGLHKLDMYDAHSGGI